MGIFAAMNKRDLCKGLQVTGDVLVCILFVVLDALAVGVLSKTWTLEASPGRLALHRWLAIGFFAFLPLLLILRMRRNLQWLMKFTHEFTHLLFALLFFRKIHRFKVDDQDSYVSFSDGWFGYHAITLSPYCIPVFVLVLLPWRFTTDSAQSLYLAVIDGLIGLAYAFHLACWISQIHLKQTDITGPGTVKSLLIIAFFQIVTFCLVVLTPGSGVQLAFERVFSIFPAEVFRAFQAWCF